MPSPFPGMDPYLEHPGVWPEIHHRLISAIADYLEDTLSLNYRVPIEKRTYLSTPEDSILVGIPDVALYRQSESTATAVMPETTSQSITVTIPMAEEVRESYLEIRDIATGDVITAIEVLSPTNKRPGQGQDAYLAKRQTVLGSRTHLVEIDLLRAGEAMPIVGQLPTSDYRILISCSTKRPHAELYCFNLEDPIPTITIPLKFNEAEIPLDLQHLLARIYDRARYGLTIDYTKPPTPALRATARNWAKQLLDQK
jgi:hypothetical protein